MLKFLRKVILQDSVILLESDDYKNNSVFQHPLFLTPEYKEFAVKLREKIGTSSHPIDQAIHAVVPLVAQSLDSLTQSVTEKIQSIHDILTDSKNLQMAQNTQWTTVSYANCSLSMDVGMHLVICRWLLYLFIWFLLFFRWAL